MTEAERDCKDAPVEFTSNPAVRMVSMILLDSIRQCGTEIQIVPVEKRIEVSYRIDGNLVLVMCPPLSLKETMISRIKIMALLDVSEKEKPQNGLIDIKVASKFVPSGRYLFDVSITQTEFGEKAVLILRREANSTPIAP
ncbi:MAG: ATPase, T2SS/T4P/T4SS family [Patescibacteria group bacterium]|jgi:type II secretory ATPase GspE/PulE/Tfp pilus assembly ATPase PilB-like protein